MLVKSHRRHIVGYNTQIFIYSLCLITCITLNHTYVYNALPDYINESNMDGLVDNILSQSGSSDSINSTDKQLQSNQESKVNQVANMKLETEKKTEKETEQKTEKETEQNSMTNSAAISINTEDANKQDASVTFVNANDIADVDNVEGVKEVKEEQNTKATNKITPTNPETKHSTEVNTDFDNIDTSIFDSDVKEKRSETKNIKQPTAEPHVSQQSTKNSNTSVKDNVPKSTASVMPEVSTKASEIATNTIQNTKNNTGINIPKIFFEDNSSSYSSRTKSNSQPVINFSTTPKATKDALKDTDYTEIKYKYKNKVLADEVLNCNEIAVTKQFKTTDTPLPKSKTFKDYLHTQPQVNSAILADISKYLGEHIKIKLKGNYVILINEDPNILTDFVDILGPVYDKTQMEICTQKGDINMAISKDTLGLYPGYNGQLEFIYRGIGFIYIISPECQPYVTDIFLDNNNLYDIQASHMRGNSTDIFWGIDSSSSITSEELDTVDKIVNKRKRVKSDITKMQTDDTELLKNYLMEDSVSQELINRVQKNDNTLFNIYSEDGDLMDYRKQMTDPVPIKNLDKYTKEASHYQRDSINTSILLICGLIDLILLMAYLYTVKRCYNEKIHYLEEKALNTSIQTASLNAVKFTNKDI